MSEFQKNKVYEIIAYSIRTVATLCAGGALMQTFLSALGFSVQLIYIHSTVLQAATVISILLGARWADTPNIIKRAALIQIPNAILFLVYIPVCIARSASMLVYGLLILTGIVQSIATGLYTVCQYKLPYYIFKKEEYGAFSGICGAVGGIITFFIGAFISWLAARHSYLVIMMYAFTISFIFMAIAALCGWKLKIVAGDKDFREAKEKIPLWVMLRCPEFSQLLLANIGKGIAAGVINVLTAVVLDIGFGEDTAAAMVSVQAVATLVACLFFTFVSGRTKLRYVAFAGSLLFVFMPMLLYVSKLWLLTLYAIIIFGRTLVDYAVPTSLLFIVPAEIAGTYNSWRMVLNNGGMLIGTAVASMISVQALLVFAVVAQLVSGISFLCVPVMKKE